jgi:hypothetical protein
MILTYDDLGLQGLAVAGPGFVEFGYQFNTNWGVVAPSAFTNGWAHAHSGGYAALDDWTSANGGNATITRSNGGTFSFLDTYLMGWNGSVSVTFTGYLDGVEVGSVTAGAYGPPDAGGGYPALFGHW